MGDNKDLEDLAKSTSEDFYLLLGVSFDCTEAEIKRAYRKTSLIYHPDKNPDDKNAADKFILLGIARDILSSTTLKAEYDRQRSRKKERALATEMFDSRRRKMKEDLEAQERGAASALNNLKRKRQDEMNDEEKKQHEIQRIGEENRKKMKQMMEKRERERQEEEASFMEPSPEAEVKPPQPGQTAEIERTVRVRFAREGESASWDKDKISNMFAKYGKIDSIVMGKDKKIRLSGEKHKKVLAIVFIVYTRLDHAHAAVLDGKQDHPALESVAWAAGAPDVKSPTNGEFSAPSTPQSTPNKFRASFNSFTRGVGATPGTPSFSFSPKTPNGASLEELTMMRLKQAEKKRLEDQIRKQEAAEEASAQV
ncbi:hypothetical protein BDV96DRAFT_582418 [Lophiotrema nucula]|uniref:J domain-containing protein n=1 Tax=Lophiotrema nucula TaxID=690887 RepID=A0A6A5YYC0_9PLEO|nr:hypothetical protein BDV96DRAFT_582418 [Lophiotrema nucula]